MHSAIYLGSPFLVEVESTNIKIEITTFSELLTNITKVFASHNVPNKYLCWMFHSKSLFHGFHGYVFPCTNPVRFQQSFGIFFTNERFLRADRKLQIVPCRKWFHTKILQILKGNTASGSILKFIIQKYPSLKEAYKNLQRIVSMNRKNKFQIKILHTNS